MTNTEIRTTVLASACVILPTWSFGVLWAVRPPGKPRSGELEIPGGKVEFGEQPVDAAVREISEELDIALKAEDLRLVHAQGVPSYRSPDEWYVQSVYLAPQAPRSLGPNAETQTAHVLLVGNIPPNATPASRMLMERVLEMGVI